MTQRPISRANEPELESTPVARRFVSIWQRAPHVCSRIALSTVCATVALCFAGGFASIKYTGNNFEIVVGCGNITYISVWSNDAVENMRIAARRFSPGHSWTVRAHAIPSPWILTGIRYRPKLQAVTLGHGSDAMSIRSITLPFWCLFLVTAAPTACFWILGRERPKQGACLNCDYDLTGNVTGRCPECGKEFDVRTILNRIKPPKEGGTLGNNPE